MSIDRRPALSSSAWVAYLRRHARAVTSEDFKPPANANLPADLRALLAGSLPAWQLAKTSGGSPLRAAARAQGDPDFLEAVEGFIREERRRSGTGWTAWRSRGSRALSATHSSAGRRFRVMRGRRWR